MADTQRDYYEVLGVPRDADDRAIKDAFRQLAMKYHPDRSEAPDAEERFKEIAEAYAILSDPKKRAEYDARGFAGVAGFSTEDLFAGIDFGDIFGDMDFGFDFGGGLFDRLFRRHRGPARGADLEVELRVSLERINEGGEETVRLVRPRTCPACGGSGARAGTSRRQCEACGGSGRQVITRDEEKDASSIRFQQITVCPVCHGEGSFIDNPCPECHGTGQAEQEESFKVTVPVGADEGLALRIPHHGLPSAERGGSAGDLYVVVRTERDPRFERRGADLWRYQEVAVEDAVLGTRITVPTLDGAVDVTVPPGVQPDEVLRLRDKGLPFYGGGRRGDLNIQIQIHIPEHPTGEERGLFRQLRELHKKR